MTPCLIPLWVNVICINQQDVREKNSQVPLMRQMCGMAVVWLGAADIDSNLTFENLILVSELETAVEAKSSKWEPRLLQLQTLEHGYKKMDDEHKVMDKEHKDDDEEQGDVNEKHEIMNK
ncbi:MAG: hypothetical protein Q9167_004214 [Letrouitia subvulpina]